MSQLNPVCSGSQNRASGPIKQNRSKFEFCNIMLLFSFSILFGDNKYGDWLGFEGLVYIGNLFSQSLYFMYFAVISSRPPAEKKEVQ